MASDMKTVETSAEPRAYLETLTHAGRKEDAFVLLELMERLSAFPPRMWGPTMIGYGSYDYTRADGSEHKSFRVGFAPRAQKMVIYLVPGIQSYTDILSRLGPFKSSVSCLYLGRLKSIDLEVLEEVILASLSDMEKKYPH